MFKNNILTITVVNNTTLPRQWVAFGYNKGLQNVPGVVVSVSQSSLEESNKESAQIPFKIKSIKIKTKTESQLNNPISIQTSDATGYSKQYSLNPIDYYEPENKIPNLVKINNPNIIISGQVGFQGIINALETMTITIEQYKQNSFSGFISGIVNTITKTNWKIKWSILPE